MPRSKCGDVDGDKDSRWRWQTREGDNTFIVYLETVGAGPRSVYRT